MPSFVRIRVAVEAAFAERLVAEAWEAGIVGLEEKSLGNGKRILLLYAESARASAVRQAVAEVAHDPAAVGAVEAVRDEDWNTAWKREIEAQVVSPRLVVRASFVSHALAQGQSEVIVDPGQAFGSGTHASTRLALELLDRTLAEGGVRPRVLDVGTGSGVLALAALRLGARQVVACDIDPLAIAAAQGNAAANGMVKTLGLVIGSIAAVRSESVDLVMANLLRAELLPLLPSLAACLRKRGRAILSGLLNSERSVVAAGLSAQGLTLTSEHHRVAHGDRWLALMAQRR